MAHVFYFFALFALMYETAYLFDTKKIDDFIERLKSKTVEQRTIKDKRFALLKFFYSCWGIVGFLTFQWYVFVFFFLWSNLEHCKNKTIKVIENIGSILIIIFIILNAYHFRIYLTL